MKNPTKVVTANSCINDWQFHQKSTGNRASDPRDFKKLNKWSIKDGRHTSTHITNFRASHDARIPFGIIKEKTLNLPEDSFSFGRKNRAQTPVNQIISN